MLMEFFPEMPPTSLLYTELAVADTIFKLTSDFKQDPFPQKISLGVGAYRDNDGKPWVLPVVAKVQTQIAQDTSLDHEYLPIEGLKSFTDASVKLILGNNSEVISQERYAAVQTLSGTGACRLGADFLHTLSPNSTVYISNPTWANHKQIFNLAGFKVAEYPYWDDQMKGLAFEKMLRCFEECQDGSIILLHPCAHNPTGVDPTLSQWQQIAQVMIKKKHLVFFDCAYQGFASGSLDNDAAAVRLFADMGIEFILAQSYAKNFGLYNERVGCLTAVTNSKEVCERVFSQFKILIRGGYSNPPAFGARIVSKVLNDPKLFLEWEDQLKTMANRIIEMRRALLDNLLSLKTPGNWDHIVNQIGMFSYTGLSSITYLLGSQVKFLRDKYHVYMTSNGRISMAGLNTTNVQRFAEAMHDAVCMESKL